MKDCQLFIGQSLEFCFVCNEPMSTLDIVTSVYNSFLLCIKINIPDKRIGKRLLRYIKGKTRKSIA